MITIMIRYNNFIINRYYLDIKIIETNVVFITMYVDLIYYINLIHYLIIICSIK